MDSITYILFTAIILLIIIACKISSNNKKERIEKQRIIDLQQSAIDALNREHSSLTQQLKKFESDLEVYRTALRDLEKERDFYKNTVDASADLNTPDIEPETDHAELDPEQTVVCKEMENTNNNFFITGKAGTGKSFLLSAFRSRTSKSHIVLAPTGIAALNVGGATLHSAFGYYNLVNLNIDTISDDTIRLKTEKRMVLQRVQTIIIDEISMVRADVFDKIDRILQVINHNTLPFGGKQILLFGDLFQLPPVAVREELEYLNHKYGGVHFFCSSAYKKSDFGFRELTINHRQKEDAAYFNLLNRVRDGTITSADIKTLNNRVSHDLSVYDRFTTLLPTKAEVEQLNSSHIRQLNSQEYVYQAKIVRDKYPDVNHSIEAIFPITSSLRLKKGVLVMMVANDPERRWVNGTLGIVSDLSQNRISVAINKQVYDITPHEFSEQEVTYEDDKLVYENILTVLQFPVIPAYAITIHKSQGQTYQNIVCDINRCFADGQAYVALSRCASLNGLHLKNPITRGSIRVNRNVLDFYHANAYPIQTTSFDPPISQIPAPPL